MAKKTEKADHRLKRYTDIERAESAKSQSQDLQQRKREGRDDGKKAREYARIERGHTA